MSATPDNRYRPGKCPGARSVICRASWCLPRLVKLARVSSLCKTSSTTVLRGSSLTTVHGRKCRCSKLYRKCLRSSYRMPSTMLMPSQPPVLMVLYSKCSSSNGCLDRDRHHSDSDGHYGCGLRQGMSGLYHSLAVQKWAEGRDVRLSIVCSFELLGRAVTANCCISASKCCHRKMRFRVRGEFKIDEPGSANRAASPKSQSRIKTRA